MRRLTRTERSNQKNAFGRCGSDKEYKVKAGFQKALQARLKNRA